MTSRFRSITDEEGMRVRARLTQINGNKSPYEEITNKSEEKQSMEMRQKVIWQKVLGITKKSLVAKRLMYKRIDSKGQLRPMQGTEMDNENHKGIIEYINKIQWQKCTLVEQCASVQFTRKRWRALWSSKSEEYIFEAFLLLLCPKLFVFQVSKKISGIQICSSLVGWQMWTWPRFTNI